MMNINSASILLHDAPVTTVSGVMPGVEGVATPQGITVATPQGITTAASGLQAAVSAPPLFTQALLNVLQAVPAGEAGLETVDADNAVMEEETADTTVSVDAPVALLQQILDGLLTVNAASAAPANPVANAVADAVNPARPGGAQPSLAGLHGVRAPVQQPASTLAEAGTLPLMQPVTLKSTESVAVQPMLNMGENVAISTARPSVQPGAMGKETPSMSPTVKLDPEPSRWAQQLQSALGERLQVQVKDQIQHATIRLDPPEMGKIDIAVQIENGRVQVTINASQGEVYRALQQVSNDLRQSLTEQNFVQVNVQVSSQNGQRDGQHQSAPQKQPQDVMAAVNIEADASARREDASVLLTV